MWISMQVIRCTMWILTQSKGQRCGHNEKAGGDMVSSSAFLCYTGRNKGNLPKGSKAYFVISIFATLMVNALDMLIPQIIRTTVDSIIGTKEPDVPGFVADMADRIGGVSYLRANLWLIGVLIVLIALGSAVCRYLSTRFNRSPIDFLLFVRRILFW